MAERSYLEERKQNSKLRSSDAPRQQGCIRIRKPQNSNLPGPSCSRRVLMCFQIARLIVFPCALLPTKVSHPSPILPEISVRLSRKVCLFWFNTIVTLSVMFKVVFLPWPYSKSNLEVLLTLRNSVLGAVFLRLRGIRASRITSEGKFLTAAAVPGGTPWAPCRTS